jgi:hypothetical protein
VFLLADGVEQYGHYANGACVSCNQNALPSGLVHQLAQELFDSRLHVEKTLPVRIPLVWNALVVENLKRPAWFP